MEYEIQYESSNTYEDIVGEAIFEFMVLPCNDSTQIVTDYTVKSSIDEHVFNYKNFFGFETSRMRTLKHFKTFGFTVKVKVQKKEPVLVPLPSMSIEEEKEVLLSNDFLIDHHIYLTRTNLNKVEKDNQQLPKFNFDKHVIDFLKEVNSFVNRSIQYNTKTTDVKTTAQSALTQRNGVCQDFAHIFIGIAINNGIPTRYVSGYLNPMRKLIGGTMMHAWVESFVPGIGWVGFDPTNNLMVDINYVKVAHGADYNDCKPIKGVLKTSGSNQTSYQVQISTQ